MTLQFDSLVRDPVHGDIPLTAEELRVLDTAEMQRLRGVRQLGTAYLVYPGAQHTRFEHSLGTCHLVQRVVEGINQARAQDPATLGSFDADELRILRLAALVHDCGHIPFGHNIEDQTGLLPRHDRPEHFAHLLGNGTELGRALAATGVRDEVLATLAPNAVPGLPTVPVSWREMISGTVDADTLDYLLRDAHYTGLHLQYDPRVFNVFRLDRASQRVFVNLARKGYLREALLSEIVRCLEARFYFSERVYFHHAKVAAGALIAKAVEIGLVHGGLTHADLQATTDFGLLDLLAQAPVSDLEQRERLQFYLSAFHSRRLPKRIGVYPMYENHEVQDALIDRFYGPGSFEERQRLEARLGEAVRFAVGREVPVLVYCPAGSMQLKEARLLVRWPGQGELRPLSDYADQVPRLGDLNRSYTEGWKFYVFAMTDDTKALDALRELCREEFPGATSVLSARQSSTDG